MMPCWTESKPETDLTNWESPHQTCLLNSPYFCSLCFLILVRSMGFCCFPDHSCLMFSPSGEAHVKCSGGKVGARKTFLFSSLSLSFSLLGALHSSTWGYDNGKSSENSDNTLVGEAEHIQSSDQQQAWSSAGIVAVQASCSPSPVEERAASRAPCVAPAQYALHRHLYLSAPWGRKDKMTDTTPRVQVRFAAPAGACPIRHFPAILLCGKFLKPERLPSLGRPCSSFRSSHQLLSPCLKRSSSCSQRGPIWPEVFLALRQNSGWVGRDGEMKLGEFLSHGLLPREIRGKIHWSQPPHWPSG